MISYLIYKKLNIVEDRMSVSSLAKLDQRKKKDNRLSGNEMG